MGLCFSIKLKRDSCSVHDCPNVPHFVSKCLEKESAYVSDPYLVHFKSSRHRLKIMLSAHYQWKYELINVTIHKILFLCFTNASFHHCSLLLNARMALNCKNGIVSEQECAKSASLYQRQL